MTSVVMIFNSIITKIIDVIELKEKLLQTNKGDKEYRGRSQKFVDGGKEKRVQWIHNVEVIIFNGYTILRSSSYHRKFLLKHLLDGGS